MTTETRVRISVNREVAAIKRPGLKTAAVLLPLFLVAGAVLLNRYNQPALLPYLFGIFFGYVLQRSRFCFAAAFRDIFLIKNTTLTRAVLLNLLLTTAGFAFIFFLSPETFNSGARILPAGWHTAAGGLIFGFGMVIAGNCVSGCLMRMGEGYLMQWYTFGGLLLGSALGAWHLGWWNQVSIARSPTVFFPHYFNSWSGALLLQFAVIILLFCLAYCYERGSAAFSIKMFPALLNQIMSSLSIRHIKSRKSWPYAAGAAALALGNTLLFYFWGAPWGISSGLTHLAGWMSSNLGLNPQGWFYFVGSAYLEGEGHFLQHSFIYLAAAMIVGSTLASLRNREFRLRRPRSIKFIFSAAAGGIMMGYSSRLVMGCNIGGLLGAIGSLSFHGWLFALAILGGAYLGGKFFMRFLL